MFFKVFNVSFYIHVVLDKLPSMDWSHLHRLDPRCDDNMHAYVGWVGKVLYIILSCFSYQLPKSCIFWMKNESLMTSWVVELSLTSYCVVSPLMFWNWCFPRIEGSTLILVGWWCRFDWPISYLTLMLKEKKESLRLSLLYYSP